MINSLLTNGIGFLIPAYNPTESLAHVVEDLKSLMTKNGMSTELFPILIVNDGSTEKESLKTLKTLESKGFEVLTNEFNQGKGYSIKAGIKSFASFKPKLAGICTLDADGQHTPDDALSLVMDFINSGASRLTLGVRFFGNNVPMRSKLGNIFTRNIFRLVSGENILDTQTGLRIIPRALFAEFIQIKSNKYDYEMEALLLATSKDFPIKQIPIKTIYDEGNPSSHFNPVRDSILIYFVFFRYLAGVFSAACIDYFVFYLLTSLDNSVLSSLIVARSVSIYFYFILARKMIFLSEEEPFLKFLKFLPLVALQIFYVNWFVGYYQPSLGENVVFSKLVAELSFFVLSFLLQRHVVFRKDSQSLQG